MKIEINLKIILVFILFIIFNNISTYLIFLFFIVVHEISHMIAGIIIGGKPKKISLNPFGLSLEFYYYGKDNFLYKIFFYLSGPMINLLIAIILYYMKNYNLYKNEIIYTNLAICFFNLIPILPLDGGKILKEILKKIVGFEKANTFLIIFSKTILIIVSFIYSILIIKIKNIMFLLLLIYLWYLYMIEERKYNIYKKANDSIKKLL